MAKLIVDSNKWEIITVFLLIYWLVCQSSGSQSQKADVPQPTEDQYPRRSLVRLSALRSPENVSLCCDMHWNQPLCELCQAWTPSYWLAVFWQHGRPGRWSEKKKKNLAFSACWNFSMGKTQKPGTDKEVYVFSQVARMASTYPRWSRVLKSAATSVCQRRSWAESMLPPYGSQSAVCSATPICVCTTAQSSACTNDMFAHWSSRLKIQTFCLSILSSVRMPKQIVWFRNNSFTGDEVASQNMQLLWPCLHCAVEYRLYFSNIAITFKLQN